MTLTCDRRAVLAAGLGVVIGLCPVQSVRGEAGPKAGAADELVRQLGAESFTQREAAEEELRQLGVPALPYLEGATDDRDLEIRYRARRLLRSIRHQQQLRLLDQFVSHYDPELAQQLAGWSRFAQLVGEDTPARQLFVEMYYAEPELMSNIDRASSRLALLLEQRSAELRPMDGRRPAATTVAAPTTAVLLLASLDPSAQVGPTTRTLINSLVTESAFRRAAVASADPPIRQLLASWVSQATDVGAATRMSIGSKFELRAAVDPALELIHQRVHGSQMQYAIFTIARLGSSAQIPVLEELLDNKTILSERQRGDEETFTCQIRDVALAALIHLIGKHPHEFGFEELRTNSNSLYALNTAGFDSDEAREAAFRQWRRWKQFQHQSGRDVDETAIEGVGV